MSSSDPRFVFDGSMARAVDAAVSIGTQVLDASGCIVHANAAFCRMIGWTCEELVGLHARRACWPDESAAHLQELFELALDGRFPPTGVRIALQRRNGERFPVLLLVSPLSTGDKNAGLVASVVDLSGEPRPDERNVDTEVAQRLDALLNRTGAAVVETALDGRIVFVNERMCDLFGFTSGELVARSLRDLTRRGEETDPSGVVQALLDGRTVSAIENRCVRKDGTPIWISGTSALIRDDRGRPERIITVLLDVSSHKAMEENLRRGLDQIQLATEGAEIGLWYWTLPGEKLEWSARCRTMLELAAGQEPSLEQLYLAMHPDDRERIKGLVAAAVEQKSEFKAEYRIVRAGGADRWISALGRVYTNPDGSVRGMGGAVIDVTERKRAADEFERMRMVMAEGERMASLGTWEYVVGTGETIWSEGECRIYGVDPLQKSPDYQRMLQERIHPDDAPELDRVFSDALKRRTPYSLDHRIVQPDGSVRLVRDLAQPHFDSAGHMVSYVGVTMDITERERVESDLRESLSLLKVAGRIARFGGWSVNLADGQQTWSDEVARIHDESPGFVPSVTDGINYYAPEWREKIAAVFGDCVQHGTPFDEEMQIVTAQGRRVWVRSVGEAVRDATGAIIQVQGAFQNIDERKHAEEQILRLNSELEQRVIERTAQLEAANRELEAFSYSVSHDLRAPLRAVDGFSQAVLEDFGPQLPSEGQRQLQTIRSSAQKMGALIDDLLRFSRLSRAPLQKQEFDTGMLVRSVIDELQRHGDGPNVELRIGDLPLCTGDPALLRQVWLNLLSNAFKYTRRREAAVVEVGCEAKPGGTIYFVRDNGAGFDMRYVDKLFGVFQRLHRAEDYEGTGVGLAIAQRVIHRHGGRIWAEAVVDRGATFYFTVPEGSNP